LAVHTALPGDLWMVDHSGATVLRCRCLAVSATRMRLCVPAGYGVAVGQRYELSARHPGEHLFSSLRAIVTLWVTVVQTQKLTDEDPDRIDAAVAVDPIGFGCTAGQIAIATRRTDRYLTIQRSIDMSRVFVGMLMATVALAGCTKSSEEGGRAGNDTFRIAVPALATDIKQGELQTAQLTLERGAGFQQRLKLEVKAPAGIQVEPSSATIEPGDKGEVQLKITAAKDAAIGEHKIKVKGTPNKGEPTETEFKITVSAK
jgi:hypothetical protein